METIVSPALENAVPAFTASLVPSRRARLHERRRCALRRRSRRMAARLAILLTADVAALFIARFVFLSVLATRDAPPALLRDFRAAGPLANPGMPASTVLWLALIF